MKRLFGMIMCLALALCMTGCGSTVAPSSESTTTTTASQTTEKSESESGSRSTSETSKEADNKTLVIVFSATGTTRGIAEKIAGIEGADLYEIKPEIPYTDEDRDWTDSNSRCSKEQNDPAARPSIGSEEIKLDGYSVIYIGYPIWFGQEPRIMDTFVESYDFGNATVIPFCTSGSSGIGNSGKNLASNAGSGNWLEGKRFPGSASEDDIKAWIESVAQTSTDR